MGNICAREGTVVEGKAGLTDRTGALSAVSSSPGSQNIHTVPTRGGPAGASEGTNERSDGSPLSASPFVASLSTGHQRPPIGDGSGADRCFSLSSSASIGAFSGSSSPHRRPSPPKDGATTTTGIMTGSTSAGKYARGGRRESVATAHPIEDMLEQNGGDMLATLGASGSVADVHGRRGRRKRRTATKGPGMLKTTLLPTDDDPTGLETDPSGPSTDVSSLFDVSASTALPSAASSVNVASPHLLLHTLNKDNTHTNSSISDNPMLQSLRGNSTSAAMLSTIHRTNDTGGGGGRSHADRGGGGGGGPGGRTQSSGAAAANLKSQQSVAQPFEEEWSLENEILGIANPSMVFDAASSMIKKDPNNDSRSGGTPPTGSTTSGGIAAGHSTSSREQQQQHQQQHTTSPAASIQKANVSVPGASATQRLSVDSAASNQMLKSLDRNASINQHRWSFRYGTTASFRKKSRTSRHQAGIGAAACFSGDLTASIMNQSQKQSSHPTHCSHCKTNTAQYSCITCHHTYVLCEECMYNEDNIHDSTHCVQAIDADEIASQTDMLSSLHPDDVVPFRGGGGARKSIMSFRRYSLALGKQSSLPKSGSPNQPNAPSNRHSGSVAAMHPRASVNMSPRGHLQAPATASPAGASASAEEDEDGSDYTDEETDEEDEDFDDDLLPQGNSPGDKKLKSADLLFEPCHQCKRQIFESHHYRCVTCGDFALCHDCFRKGTHQHDPTHILRIFNRRVTNAEGATASSAPNSARDSRRSSIGRHNVPMSPFKTRNKYDTAGNRIINDYVIVKEVGRGSFAKVFLLQKIATGSLYAVKILRREVLGTDENESISSHQSSTSVSPKASHLVTDMHATMKSSGHSHSSSSIPPSAAFPGLISDEFHAPQLPAIIPGAAYRRSSVVPEGVPRRDRSRAPTVMDTLREIAVLKAVQHQNIVKLVEVIDDPIGQKVFLIMEFLECGVFHTLGQPPLDPETLLKRTTDILAALLHLHSQMLYHQDIKPANVLVGKDGTAKITDFGTCDSRRKVNGVKGTPAFLSPELVRGEDCDGAAADAWAFGVTLFQGATGKLPFPITNFYVFNAALNSADPVDIPEHLSPSLRDILTGLLEKNPNKRVNLWQAANHAYFKDVEKYSGRCCPIVQAKLIHLPIYAISEERQKHFRDGSSIAHSPKTPSNDNLPHLPESSREPSRDVGLAAAIANNASIDMFASIREFDAAERRNTLMQQAQSYIVSGANVSQSFYGNQHLERSRSRRLHQEALHRIDGRASSLMNSMDPSLADSSGALQEEDSAGTIAVSSSSTNGTPAARTLVRAGSMHSSSASTRHSMSRAAHLPESADAAIDYFLANYESKPRKILNLSETSIVLNKIFQEKMLAAAKHVEILSFARNVLLQSNPAARSQSPLPQGGAVAAADQLNRLRPSNPASHANTPKGSQRVHLWSGELVDALPWVSFSKLTRLRMNHLGFVSFPVVILGNCLQLQQLDLNYNHITLIPTCTELSDHPSLETLSIEANDLYELPPFSALPLKTFRRLNASANIISALPKQLAESCDTLEWRQNNSTSNTSSGNASRSQQQEKVELQLDDHPEVVREWVTLLTKQPLVASHITLLWAFVYPVPLIFNGNCANTPRAQQRGGGLHQPSPAASGAGSGNSSITTPAATGQQTPLGGVAVIPLSRQHGCVYIGTDSAALYFGTLKKVLHLQHFVVPKTMASVLDDVLQNTERIAPCLELLPPSTAAVDNSHQTALSQGFELSCGSTDEPQQPSARVPHPTPAAPTTTASSNATPYFVGGTSVDGTSASASTNSLHPQSTISSRGLVASATPASYSGGSGADGTQHALSVDGRPSHFVVGVPPGATFQLFRRTRSSTAVPIHVSTSTSTTNSHSPSRELQPFGEHRTSLFTADGHSQPPSARGHGLDHSATTTSDNSGNSATTHSATSPAEKALPVVPSILSLREGPLSDRVTGLPSPLPPLASSRRGSRTGGLPVSFAPVESSITDSSQAASSFMADSSRVEYPHSAHATITNAVTGTPTPASSHAHHPHHDDRVPPLANGYCNRLADTLVSYLAEKALNAKENVLLLMDPAEATNAEIAVMVDALVTLLHQHFSVPVDRAHDAVRGALNNTGTPSSPTVFASAVVGLSGTPKGSTTAPNTSTTSATTTTVAKRTSITRSQFRERASSPTSSGNIAAFPTAPIPPAKGGGVSGGTAAVAIPHSNSSSHSGVGGPVSFAGPGTGTGVGGVSAIGNSVHGAITMPPTRHRQTSILSPDSSTT